MEKIKKGLKWFFKSYIWIGILLFIADLVSKLLIVTYQNNILNGGGQHNGIDLIPGFLGINYVINPTFMMGISLGSYIANRIVYLILSFAIMIGIVIFLIKRWDKTKTIYRVIAIMVFAGALGNSIDRIFYNAEFLNSGNLTGVVDWIDFYGIWQFNFNIADCSVVIAAIMLLITVIVEMIEEAIQNKKLKQEKAATEGDKKDRKVEKIMSKTERETLELRQKDSNKNE